MNTFSENMNKLNAYRDIPLDWGEWSDNVEFITKSKPRYTIVGSHFKFYFLDVGDALLFRRSMDEEPFAAGIIEAVDEGDREQIEAKYCQNVNKSDLITARDSFNIDKMVGMILRRVDPEETLKEYEIIKASISKEEWEENKKWFRDQLVKNGF